MPEKNVKHAAVKNRQIREGEEEGSNMRPFSANALLAEAQFSEKRQPHPRQ